MRFPGAAALWWAVHRFKKQFASRAVILTYHGITEVGSDPWSLRVTPAYFAEHLEVITKYGHPMSLNQLAQAHQQGNIPNRAVVVTFDDGYADNLYNAKPLLEQYDIPATVFLTTGHIGSNREFWWDELDRLLLQPGTLPDTLRFTINGNHYQWELGQAATYTRGEFKRQHGQKAFEGEPGSRLGLYYSIWKLLLSLPHNVRCKVLDDMALWAGAALLARPTHRVLSLEEVDALNQGDLIEIGAHTVTHPFLSAFPPARQAEEIQQSKGYLENILGQPITTFSYPHGDFTTDTISLITEAGFACACTVVAESVWSRSARYQLPRFEVQNWNGEEFARRLLRWFHN